MAVQFNPVSPFQMFQPNGPLGFWPNNFAANAGDVPNVLWVTSLQTPVLNSFSPVMPPLVTNIFGSGAAPLGSATRPAPLGAFPNSLAGIQGTTLQTPATSVVGSTANGTLAASQGMANFGSLAGLNGLVGGGGLNTGGISMDASGINAALTPSMNMNNLAIVGGGPGFGSVGGQAFNGNGSFIGQLMGINTMV